jgi:hypothetical protein
MILSLFADLTITSDIFWHVLLDPSLYLGCMKPVSILPLTTDLNSGLLAALLTGRVLILP